LGKIGLGATAFVKEIRFFGKIGLGAATHYRSQVFFRALVSIPPQILCQLFVALSLIWWATHLQLQLSPLKKGEH
jgi:hypothetical protein